MKLGRSPLMAWAVLPFNSGAILADINVGLLTNAPLVAAIGVTPFSRPAGRDALAAVAHLFEQLHVVNGAGRLGRE